MFFYGIPLWTEKIIINSVLVLNVGSVEKIVMKKGEGQCPRHLAYTHTHIEMVERTHRVISRFSDN